MAFFVDLRSTQSQPPPPLQDLGRRQPTTIEISLKIDDDRGNERTSGTC